MVGHHDTGVLDIDPSQAALFAEKDMLVSSIVSGGGGGGVHAATIQALGDFLIRFSNEGRIPYLRIYQSFPAWQEKSGLLTEYWDRNAAQERAKVIFTLITSQRSSISRKAFGGGTWKSTGAETIGRNQELVLSKLYYKRDGANTPSPRASQDCGFTAFELHRKMELQPKVAICVLLKKGYPHCIPDLKNYIRQGWFPGENPANLQMLQPLPTFYPDYYAAEFITGPHVAYTNNLAFNSERNILGANQVEQMAVQHEGQYLDLHAGFMNGPHTDYTIIPVSNTEACCMGGSQANLPREQPSEPIYAAPNDAGFLIGAQVDVTNPVPNSEIESPDKDYLDLVFSTNNLMSETCYGEPLIHSSLEAPLPPASFDDLSQFLFPENNSMAEFGGQHSHADELLMLNDFYNTLNETTTTESSLEPFPLWDDLLYNNVNFTQYGD